MKKTSKTHCIFLLSALFFFAYAFAAEARVDLDITSARTRKVPVAVPYFLDRTGGAEKITDSGRQMADLMGRGLEFHGFMSVIDPANYGGRQDTDWQRLGAEFTVMAHYQTGSDGVTIELRLVDIKDGKMLLGRRYRGAWDTNKEMVLKFCDEIILKLTGEAGISRTKIAFVSNGSGAKEIYLADVLGQNIRQVTRHNNIALSPRFSPDGGKLAYTSYHRGNPNLYVTELSQSTSTRAISRKEGLNMAPAWSPDGTKMAITLSMDGNPDLYIMNMQGDVSQRLTKNEGINVSPCWSPDGSRLAFVSDRTGTPQIYIMDMRTRTVSRITYSGNENTTPSWSPKGDFIAYTGLANGSYQIFLISPEGGPAVQLTKNSGSNESPSWSPDGRQIVFSNKSGGQRRISAIFRNGAGMRTLFQLNGEQTMPQWSPKTSL